MNDGGLIFAVEDAVHVFSYNYNIIYKYTCFCLIDILQLLNEEIWSLRSVGVKSYLLFACLIYLVEDSEFGKVFAKEDAELDLHCVGIDG